MLLNQDELKFVGNVATRILPQERNAFPVSIVCSYNTFDCGFYNTTTTMFRKIQFLRVGRLASTLPNLPAASKGLPSRFDDDDSRKSKILDGIRAAMSTEQKIHVAYKANQLALAENESLIVQLTAKHTKALNATFETSYAKMATRELNGRIAVDHEIRKDNMHAMGINSP